ncbi:MAG: VWA domain-containing protein [Sandaracinaceae bacterium]|nr:VWA domain-containing protein [Sandaracinaceae bacterium]
MLMRPWLVVGLALLVPILIAFLYRTQDRVASVPSTLLFRQIALVRARTRRLRDLLSRLAFFACLAGVAALVLAAAEPRGIDDPRTIVIVADVSASMGGATERELRDQVQRLLRTTNGRDMVALVAAGARPRVLSGPSGDATALADAARALTAERGEADLGAALRLADALLDGAYRPRIWLVSDGGRPIHDETLALAAPLRVLRVGADRDNVGVAVLAARAPLDAASDEEREVLATVVASGGRARHVSLVLEADGVELARRSLEVPGGASVEATFRLRVAARELAARVTPTDGGADALPSDDVARLALGAARAQRAVLVAPEAHPAAFFAERALRAAGIAAITRYAPADAPRALDEGAIAVVVGAAPAHRIGGPTLFLDARTGAIPVAIGAPLGAGATALRSIDRAHTLARGVELDGATIARATPVELGPRDEAIVELDGGTVLAAGGAGGDRWVFLGVDPTGSDLVLRVAFPVLVANAVAALSGAADERVAETLPRDESALAASAALASAPPLREPFPWPVGLPFALAGLAAVVLSLEGLAYLRGYAR